MRSQFLRLNTRDFIKGLVVAILSSILTGLYQLIINHAEFNMETLKPVLLNGLAAGLAYLLKNLGTNSEGKLLSREPKAP